MMNLELKDIRIDVAFNTKEYAFDSSPQLSIIIVTFNRSNFLDELLKSLQNQSFRNFEIIVVDNNSKDNTKHLIFNYNLLYIRLNQNYGLSLARNIGLKYAQGDIVCFLDDDAVVDKTFVNSHYEGHIRQNIFCLRGKALPRSKTIYNCIPYHYDLGDEIIPSPINLEGNSSFKKSILDDVGGFDPDLFINGHEGIDITYRILKNFNFNISKCIYYPKAVIYHDYANSIFEVLRKTYQTELKSQKQLVESPDMIKFLGQFPPIKNRVKNKECHIFIKFYKIFIILLRYYLHFKSMLSRID